MGERPLTIDLPIISLNSQKNKKSMSSSVEEVFMCPYNVTQLFFYIQMVFLSHLFGVLTQFILFFHVSSQVLNEPRLFLPSLHLTHRRLSEPEHTLIIRVLVDFIFKRLEILEICFLTQ